MDRKQIVNSIIAIISNNVTGTPLLTETTQLSEISINSLNFLKIIVDIEEQYNIEFDEDELGIDFFKSVKSLADYIEGKIQNANSVSF